MVSKGNIFPAAPVLDMNCRHDMALLKISKKIMDSGSLVIPCRGSEISTTLTTMNLHYPNIVMIFRLQIHKWSSSDMSINSFQSLSSILLYLSITSFVTNVDFKCVCSQSLPSPLTRGYSTPDKCKSVDVPRSSL
jgi:hypothetical protein